MHTSEKTLSQREQALCIPPVQQEHFKRSTTHGMLTRTQPYRSLPLIQGNTHRLKSWPTHGHNN